jgi:hypothetical protein
MVSKRARVAEALFIAFNPDMTIRSDIGLKHYAAKAANLMLLLRRRGLVLIERKRRKVKP